MATTIASPAPAAASSPAPVSSPAPASPAPVAPANPAPTASPVGNSGVTSAVDPGKFGGNKNAYAEAVLAEQLAEVPADAPSEEVVPELIPDTEVTPEVTPEVPAPEPVVEEPKPAEDTEPDFELEPEAVVTPDSLSKMVTDNPEFGKLLEADPKLKGQLYKTAREAAELKPYRDIFPDLESAKAAVTSASDFNDVRNVFMGSTTKEGTQSALRRMAELSYERDEAGNVVMDNGQPVVGDDFYSFVNHTVQLDLESRYETAKSRFAANQYHVGAKTQEEADAAFEKDRRLVDAYAEIMGDVVEAPSAAQDLPEPLRKQKEALDAREKALAEKEHGGKVQSRTEFESGIVKEAQTRITDGIGKILTNIEKQGGVISPFLKDVLPKSIGAKLVAKIQANPSLQSQMQELQRLPIGDASKQRRIAAIDRAVQQYLPDIAREEIRNAGIQTKANAEAKLAKVQGQALTTQETEPKGATAPAGLSNKPMDAKAAMEYAQKEWEQKNPNKRFDSVARSQILGRVVNLQLYGR